MVLGAGGGALKEMILPFKLGLGSSLGDGGQWMSWIHMRDMVEGLIFLMEKELKEFQLSGSNYSSSTSSKIIIDESESQKLINTPHYWNFTAPRPETNLEFSKALAAALHRPLLLKLPGFAARAIMGEVADGILLESPKVVPKKLVEAGFKFRFPRAKEALEDVVKEY